MPYRLQVSQAVGDILRNFHLDLKKSIKTACCELADNPYQGKELQEELAGYLSFRVKRYRIVYTVNENEKIIIIHLVWHRKNVYELLADLVRK